MRLFLGIVLSMLLIASCVPNTPDGEEEVLKVYVGGVDSSDLVLYEYSVSDEELSEPALVLSGVTGEISESEDGILVPSSGVVYEISNSGTEAILEGDDVFRLAVEVEDTVVALGENGIYAGDEFLNLKARGISRAEGGVYILSDDGIRYLKIGDSESVLLLEGEYKDLLYDQPYLYLLGSTSLKLYLVGDENSLEFQDSWEIPGVVGELELGEGGDILVGGDDGLWILRFGEFYRVVEHPVDDFGAFGDLIFVVSDYKDSLEIWNVSDISKPEKILEREGLNLSNPSVLVEEE